MPRMEFGSFYRFLTSAGIFLVALGLAYPWLTAQLVSVLRIPEAELAGLTPSARESISGMQGFVENVVATQSLYSNVALSVGILLLAVGVVTWFLRQRVADRLEDWARIKAELEVEKMNSGERLAKLTAEAAELLDREKQAFRDEPMADPPDNTNSEGGNTQAAGQGGSEDEEPLRREPPTGSRAEPVSPPLAGLRREIGAIEGRIAELLEEGFGARYSYEPSVVVRDRGVDLLLLPRSRNVPALVIEIKLTRRKSQVRSVTRLVAQQLSYLKRIGVTSSGPDVIGIGIVVVAEIAEPSLLDVESSMTLEFMSVEDSVLIIQVGETYLTQTTGQDFVKSLNRYLQELSG